MELIQTRIKNFRSIKDITIKFGVKCRALLGINESGKSNILKALSLLDSEREIVDADLRDYLPDDDITEESVVSFHFSIDKNERVELIELVLAKILAVNDADNMIFSNNKLYNIQSFINNIEVVKYIVDIKRKKKYWLIPYIWSEHAIDGAWFFVDPKTTTDFDIVLRESNEVVSAHDYSIIDSYYIGDQSANYPYLTYPDLRNFIDDVAVDYLNEAMPNCLYWTYSDAQLLPAQIQLESFAAKPNTCEPLKQMFALAQHDDILSTINEAKKRPNGIRNLLNRVSAKATEHMRSVWKEYRGISIELLPNGVNIDAHIKDEHNLYNFERRSDGFKRFISFLLLVSAKAKTKQLENTLYLHDEPDTGLHPSGARYLRDELIKISKNNYVVYSTHSIFMVDRDKVDRHIIVKKESEVTSVSDVDDSNINEEEVLYNALGYSLFEMLKPINIIFEGWRDKNMFLTMLASTNAKSRALKKRLANVGTCHAKGVKDIARITPLLELAQRKWVVISDSDNAAKEQQRSYTGAGPWFRYDELVHGTAYTGEDFVKLDHIKTAVNHFLKKHPDYEKPDYESHTGDFQKYRMLREWLVACGENGEQLRLSLDCLKDDIFNDLKAANIEDKYYDMCEKLAEKIESMM
jgi:AAA15 family ATPase/GTPase